MSQGSKFDLHPVLDLEEISYSSPRAVDRPGASRLSGGRAMNDTKGNPQHFSNLDIRGTQYTDQSFKS